MAKESTSTLVKVTKNGEFLEVNPATLEAHKRSGWTEVKEDQEVKAVPLVPTQAADVLKLSTAGGSEEEEGGPALQNAPSQSKRGKG